MIDFMHTTSDHIHSIYDMFPETVEYANAYVPFQVTAHLFNQEQALCNGTVFRELHQPCPTIKGVRA